MAFLPAFSIAILTTSGSPMSKVFDTSVALAVSLSDALPAAYAGAAITAESEKTK
jgi:hypothetical protein